MHHSIGSKTEALGVHTVHVAKGNARFVLCLGPCPLAFGNVRGARFFSSASSLLCRSTLNIGHRRSVASEHQHLVESMVWESF